MCVCVCGGGANLFNFKCWKAAGLKYFFTITDKMFNLLVFLVVDWLVAIRTIRFSYQFLAFLNDLWRLLLDCTFNDRKDDFAFKNKKTMMIFFFSVFATWEDELNDF